MPGVSKTNTDILRKVLIAGLVWLWTGVTLAASYHQNPPKPSTRADRSREVSTGWIVLPSQFSSWRPYSNEQVLVTLGMTKGEVLLKAGPPALDEVISLGTDGHPTRSVWTYIRTGFNTSITTLTFQGNRLVRIDIKLSN